MPYMTSGSSTSRCWRVFYTAPRSEKRCEQALLKQEIDVFLPKYIEIHQWKDRKKRFLEPLFPRYLFARVDERDRLHVLETPGIVFTVSFGGRLARVTDDEIEQLKIVQKEPDRIYRLTHPLPEVGDLVQIDRGQLAGLRGEVIEIRGELNVVIRIESIRQVIRVNVSNESLQKIPKAA